MNIPTKYSNIPFPNWVLKKSDLIFFSLNICWIFSLLIQRRSIFSLFSWTKVMTFSIPCIGFVYIKKFYHVIIVEFSINFKCKYSIVGVFS